MTLLRKLFPCKFAEPLCRARPFGCRCGKKKSAEKKVEARADDLATQTRQAVTEATQMTPEEQAFRSQMLQAFQGQLPAVEARAGETGGQLFEEISPQAKQLADVLSQRLQTPPSISWENQFDPLFQQAKQGVSAFANQRGIVGSGLELERLGRAGVELALSQAQARYQNAILNEQLRSGTISDVASLVGSQSGLSDQARSELMSYLGTGLTQGDVFRQRQAGGAVQAQAAAQPYFQQSVDALQNRVNRSGQMVGNIGKGVGTLAAILAAGPTGGASLAAIPEVPTGYGDAGYHGAGYANYPQLYNQLYNPSQQNNVNSYLASFRGFR